MVLYKTNIALNSLASYITLTSYEVNYFGSFTEKIW